MQFSRLSNRTSGHIEIAEPLTTPAAPPRVGLSSSRPTGSFRQGQHGKSENGKLVVPITACLQVGPNQTIIRGQVKLTKPTCSADGDYYESTIGGLPAYTISCPSEGTALSTITGEDSWTDCRKAVDEFRRERGIDDPMCPVNSNRYYWKHAR